MRAYRTYVVVEDSGQVTRSDMPFQAGERVEVVVIADEPASRHHTHHAAPPAEDHARFAASPPAHRC